MGMDTCWVPGCGYKHDYKRKDGQLHSLFCVRRSEFGKTAADKEDRELLIHFILFMRDDEEETRNKLKREK